MGAVAQRPKRSAWLGCWRGARASRRLSSGMGANQSDFWLALRVRSDICVVGCLIDRGKLLCAALNICRQELKPRVVGFVARPQSACGLPNPRLQEAWT